MGEKIKKTISLSSDTAARLKQHAELRHTTISQLITFWTWQIELPGIDSKPFHGQPIKFAEKY